MPLVLWRAEEPATKREVLALELVREEVVVLIQSVSNLKVETRQIPVPKVVRRVANLSVETR